MKRRNYKIGVYGSAVNASDTSAAKARALGKALAEHHCTVITGACPGLPYEAAREAATQGANVWGFSPAGNSIARKRAVPYDDTPIYGKLIFVPKNFPFASSLTVSKKYRNVVSTATADAGIIIAGRWGTLHEFTSLYDFGKVIGVLTGTGGIADELTHLMKKISKPSKAKVLFHSSPATLVKRIITELKERT